MFQTTNQLCLNWAMLYANLSQYRNILWILLLYACTPVHNWCHWTMVLSPFLQLSLSHGYGTYMYKNDMLTTLFFDHHFNKPETRVHGYTYLKIRRIPKHVPLENCNISWSQCLIFVHTHTPHIVGDWQNTSHHTQEKDMLTTVRYHIPDLKMFVQMSWYKPQ